MITITCHQKLSITILITPNFFFPTNTITLILFRDYSHDDGWLS